uniref:Uncharacterized protein n=1 Tax=Plectus sambesii TaxID=2011161 RepID=A0A914W940_9BILA
MDELTQCSIQEEDYRQGKSCQSTEKIIAQMFTQHATHSLIGNQPPPKPLAWQAGGRSTYSKYYRTRGSVCWYVCRLIQHVCLPHLCESCRLIISHAGQLAFENYGDLRHGN